MKIEYYDRGAEVEFTEEETGKIIRYDHIIFRDSALNAFSGEERNKLIRKKLALLSVADNMNMVNEIRGMWNPENVFVAGVKRIGESGYIYRTGMNCGKVNKEVFIMLTEKRICEMIRFYDKELDYYYSSTGKPVREDDDDSPVSPIPGFFDEDPFDFNGPMYTERNEKEGEDLHLYGGTLTIPGLKEYIPDDIRGAKIFQVDGRFYILGHSNAPEKMEKYITEQYFVSHYKSYADEFETKKIIDLLMN